VTGRFVAVGDENQSIYEFIGANRQSFDEFKNHKNTVTLPLSVSYRCPKSVIKEANKIFEGVEAYEGNIEGEVRKGDIDEVTDGDFVLCRNNFPLFELWMYFIVNKKKAVIYGKDLEKTLTALVGKVSGFDDEEVVEELDKLLRKVSDELRAKGVANTSHHPKFVMLEENITIVKLLLNRYKTIKNVETHLQDIFSNIISKGITMMSCHRSKGLENDRIFFYKSSLIPSKYAETPEQLCSESCLFYVTLTRAKKSLIFID
jgi:superfamily I DNA/RNA helicase